MLHGDAAPAPRAPSKNGDEGVAAPICRLSWMFMVGEKSPGWRRGLSRRSFGEGGWGFPDDIGRAVAALARGDLPFSTGQVVMVDGGLTIPRL